MYMIRQAGTYINKYINLWMALSVTDELAGMYAITYSQETLDGESYSIDRWMDRTRISHAAVHTHILTYV